MAFGEGGREAMLGLARVASRSLGEREQLVGDAALRYDRAVGDRLPAALDFLEAVRLSDDAYCDRARQGVARYRALLEES